MKPVLVLNGPNLDRLDLRSKSIYGDFDYAELARAITGFATEAGFHAEVRQSNDEAELIKWLHEAADKKLSLIHI